MLLKCLENGSLQPAVSSKISVHKTLQKPGWKQGNSGNSSCRGSLWTGTISSYTGSGHIRCKWKGTNWTWALGGMYFFSDTHNLLNEYILPSGNSNSRAAIYQVLTGCQALTWTRYKVLPDVIPNITLRARYCILGNSPSRHTQFPESHTARSRREGIRTQVWYQSPVQKCFEVNRQILKVFIYINTYINGEASRGTGSSHRGVLHPQLSQEWKGTREANKPAVGWPCGVTLSGDGASPTRNYWKNTAVS